MFLRYGQKVTWPEARPWCKGHRSGHVDLLPNAQFGQIVGSAHLGRPAVLGRIFQDDVPAFGRDGEQLGRLLERAALEALAAAVKDDRLVGVRQAGLVRPDVIDDVSLGFVQNKSVLVRSENQIPLAA